MQRLPGFLGNVRLWPGWRGDLPCLLGGLQSARDSLASGQG